jgi:hypothetical protein
MLSAMARIFYIGGGTHARGMLRAVISVEQLESLLPPEFVTHIGHEFPEVCDDAAITLVEIAAEEGTARWPAGFCRIEAAPTDFDERLKFLPESEECEVTRARHVRRSGSGLVHWLTQDMRAHR